jgi:hypothetical protein
MRKNIGPDSGSETQRAWPCYPLCYPTRDDSLGKRTIQEREFLVISGAFKKESDL